jgi:DNA repair exonuclease SbcCD ATPase subunit
MAKEQSPQEALDVGKDKSILTHRKAIEARRKRNQSLKKPVDPNAQSYADRISHAAQFDQNSMYYMMLMDNAKYGLSLFFVATGLSLAFMEGPEWAALREQDLLIREQMSALKNHVNEMGDVNKHVTMVEETLSRLENTNKELEESIKVCETKLKESHEKKAGFSLVAKGHSNLESELIKLERQLNDNQDRQAHIQKILDEKKAQQNQFNKLTDQISSLQNQLNTFDPEVDTFDNITLYSFKENSYELDYSNPIKMMPEEPDTLHALLQAHGLQIKPTVVLRLRETNMDYTAKMIGSSPDPLFALYKAFEQGNATNNDHDARKEQEDYALRQASLQKPMPRTVPRVK